MRVGQVSGGGHSIDVLVPPDLNHHTIIYNFGLFYIHYIYKLNFHIWRWMRKPCRSNSSIAQIFYPYI